MTRAIVGFPSRRIRRNTSAKAPRCVMELERLVEEIPCEIPPGREGAVACAGDDHHPDHPVGGGGAERIAKLLHHGERQRVAPLGIVDDQPGGRSTHLIAKHSALSLGG